MDRIVSSCSTELALIDNGSLGKKFSINQVTTMQAISKIVLFPGHNHVLTTSADGNPSRNRSPCCWCLGDNQSVGSSGSYDLEIGYF